MTAIVIEFDTDELKKMVAGILAERVMRILPYGTKLDLAHDVQKEAKRIATEQLTEQLKKELETI